MFSTMNIMMLILAFSLHERDKKRMRAIANAQEDNDIRHSRYRAKAVFEASSKVSSSHPTANNP
jgi:hypothetical protein